MILKKLIAGAASLALVTSPVVASAQVAPVPSEEQLAGQRMEGGDNTWIWIGAGVVALALFLILVLDDDDDDEVSP